MAAVSATSPETEAPSQAAILGMLAGRWVCGAVAAAARFGIADALAAGPCTSDALAPRLRAHGPSLYRLLRALASLGLLTEDGDGRFALTALGDYLRGDVPGSLLGVARYFASEEHGASWNAAPYSVASGEPAFAHLFGRTLWEYLDDDPALNAMYCAASAALESAVARQIVDRLLVGSARTVVDVGGAGVLLSALLERHRAMRGVVYDRPAAIVEATRRAPPVLRERADLIAGDVVRRIPAADLIVLNRVLHCWSDADTLRILSNCRAALPPHGRLAVIESALAPGASKLAALLDLEMLVLGDGRERTRRELESFLGRAGLRPVASAALAGITILEAVRA
jgi:SAM-dependent methyltransferase